MPFGYVATDLELRASGRLPALAEVLSTDRHVVHADLVVAEEGWIFRIQTNDSGFEEPTASSVERDVNDLITALEGLEGAAREELRACSRIDVDVAFQSGRTEHNFELPPELLSRVARTGASIVVTVYPAEPPE